jgi:O-succinylbenzoic acid--CoA ligase
LVPTQLSRLLDTPARDFLKAMDGIVLGGARLTPELRARAHDLPITAAYGMSETASGCVYDGVPLDGVDIRLDNGRVAVKGPTLARGYRLNPALTRELFVDGWFLTADLGTVENGRLEILGRADDVINTGGVKVAASAVESVLERHAKAACVVGLDDPEWGEVVAALVVGDIGPARDEIRAELGAPAVPKHIHVVDELPLRGPGKVDRVKVREYLAQQARQDNP